MQSLLQELDSHLLTVRRVIEKWYYITNINYFRLKYVRIKFQLSTSLFQTDILYHKDHRSMSLFVDEKGRPPPSNSEAIQKAEEKQHLPLFRKKYDWNIPMWNPQNQKRLKQFIAMRITTDLVKLSMEQKLWNNELQDYALHEYMSQERRKLQESKPITQETLLKNLLSFEQLLYDKALRTFNTPPSNKKEFLIITSKEHKESIIHMDKRHFNETTWYQYLKTTYWTQLFDDMASMMGSAYEWSGRDCQIQWLHHLSPQLNLSAMTSEEDHFLKQLSDSSSTLNWNQIATQLNTNRTAYQCFERYQRCFNKAIQSSDWRPEEDAELIERVNQLGPEISGPYKWKYVALQLPGRSNLQCRARYLYTLKSNLKQGNWDYEEDILLQLCVIAYNGCRWSKIAQHFPNRTDMKCRERYEGVLRDALAEPFLDQPFEPLMESEEMPIDQRQWIDTALYEVMNAFSNVTPQPTILSRFTLNLFKFVSFIKQSHTDSDLSHELPTYDTFLKSILCTTQMTKQNEVTMSFNASHTSCIQEKQFCLGTFYVSLTYIVSKYVSACRISILMDFLDAILQIEEQDMHLPSCTYKTNLFLKEDLAHIYSCCDLLLQNLQRSSIHTQ